MPLFPKVVKHASQNQPQVSRNTVLDSVGYLSGAGRRIIFSRIVFTGCPMKCICLLVCGALRRSTLSVRLLIPFAKNIFFVDFLTLRFA